MVVDLKDKKVLSLFGHIIVANNQIHNYQIRYVEQFLSDNNLSDSYHFIKDIFSNADAVVKKDIALELLKKESNKIKDLLYQELYVVASLDGVFEEEEKELLDEIKPFITDWRKMEDKANIIANSTIADYQKYDQKKRDILDFSEEKRNRQLLDYINRIRGVFKKSGFETKGLLKDIGKEDLFKKFLNKSISDYNTLQNVYMELTRETDKIIKEIENIKSKGSKEKYDEETIKNLEGIGEKIKLVAKNELESIRNELIKKERSIKYFTISFLGRTKAGKSTLHTILTGGDQSAIGEGKQRTTRYNRVFQLGELRFIDTPGIDAAEEDGKKDEEIALSIISESDIVCIMISDDNISTKTIELAEKIARYNKPVIILINHKENLNDNIRRKRFFRNPSAWKEKGNRDLYGHIDKIERDALNRGFSDMLKIYPVFLLPALMALNIEDNREILVKNSNVELFKKELQEQIKKVGVLLRSQTLLDHSRRIIGDARREVIIDIENTNKVTKDLENRQISISKSLEKEKEDLLFAIKSIFNNYFDRLENYYAIDFAELYYDHSNSGNRWKIYIEDKKLDKDLNIKIEYEIEKYSRKVEDIIEKQNKDLLIGIENNLSFSGANINMFDFKKAITVTGGLLSLGLVAAGILGLITGPVGWIATGIGVLATGISSLFKSKAKKRQEAINKLYNNIVNSINENKPKTIKEVLSKMEKTIDESHKAVYNSYDSLKRAMIISIEKAEELSRKYEEAIKKLDFYYACRILEYIVEEEDRSIDAIKIISHVEREYGKDIIINVKGNYHYSNLKIDSIREIINVKGE